MSVAKSLVIIFNTTIKIDSFRTEVNNLRSDLFEFNFLFDKPFKTEFSGDDLNDVLLIKINYKDYQFDVNFYKGAENNSVRLVELSTHDYDIFENVTDNNDFLLKQLMNFLISDLSNVALIMFYADSDLLYLDEVIHKYDEGRICATNPYKLLG